MEDRSILFDAGQSDVLLHNANILGVPWDEVEAIALSHGHYDHTGGLAFLPGITVHAHPAAWSPHCARGRGRLSFIGSPLSKAEIEGRGASVIESEEPTELLPGVWLSGQIPRPHSFEDPTFCRDFYLDLPGRPPDPIQDDQALFIESQQGLIVVLGCAHSGLLNTLELARSFDSKIFALVGGLHLIGAPPERLGKTLSFLEKAEISRLVAGHCTGWKACHLLEEAFAERFSIMHAGQILSF